MHTIETIYIDGRFVTPHGTVVFASATADGHPDTVPYSVLTIAQGLGVMNR